MRGNIKEIKRGGYLFVLEVDTGGDGTEYTCWVYKKNGEELRDDKVRKYFGNHFSMAHFNNFINKFIEDEDYRNKLITKKENEREGNTMSKYYIIAEMTMEDGTVVTSDKINHIEDAQGNIIHERILDMNYEELNMEYKYGNVTVCAYEIKDFVEDYFKKKLNLDSVSEMDSFKFIFVENETNEFSHCLEMNPIVKYIDYDITLHKVDIEKVVLSCIDTINKSKEAILTIKRKGKNYFSVKMKINEVRETSEKYYFSKDYNELQIEREKIGDVRVQIIGNFIQFVWIYKNGDVMDISVTVNAKKN